MYEREYSDMESDVPRYSRHVLLKVIGEDGQKRIEKSRVFVAGLGALGSLIATLLARAGVGFLRIADQDAPELHNLHRQILYDENDVHKGLHKALAAERRLTAANSCLEIEAICEAIGPDNVEQLTGGVDLVVDALDNIRTRYLVNDCIIATGTPYIFGGAVETVGNVMTIIPGKTPCLRCLWPDPAAVDGHPRASTVGVLSSAASCVASIEVTEALKILAGREREVMPGLLVMDVWRSLFHVAPVDRDPGCVCHIAVRSDR
jgi:molybdopterin-synthase adenylyltransferase